MAVIPPGFFNTVVAIGFGEQPHVEYQATGFLFGRDAEEPGQCYVCLVTCKHVLRDETVAWLRFNPKSDDAAKEIKLVLKPSGLDLTASHASLDVAAIVLDAGTLVQLGMDFSFFKEGQNDLSVGRSRAIQLGISEGQSIFLLGFPLGNVGDERNFVIVRHGIIARIQHALAGRSDVFLIDASFFPGNSGGPVITRPEIFTITGTASPKACHLIGMVGSFLGHKNPEVYQIVGPGKAGRADPPMVFLENSGLAEVVMMDPILETVDAAIRRYRQVEETIGLANRAP